MAELVLLTGATGKLGFRVLVDALQKGYRVRAVTRNHEGFEKIKNHLLTIPYQSHLEGAIVPDMSAEGAYDEAVKGVDSIIHVASPLPKPSVTDYREQIINPATRGTVGMLESAMKAPTVKRIVITASIGSIIPGEKLQSGDSTIYNEKTECPSPPESFDNALQAYLASKIIAFRAAAAFVADHSPPYDVINILPGYFVGREELATEAKALLLGTNRIALAQLLGHPEPHGVPSTSALISDVAKAHVLSLNRSIPGNQNFVISSDGLQGTTWADAIEIVSSHYSRDMIEAAGFKLDGRGTPTNRILIDTTHSRNILGMEFQSYQEQILSVVNQYFELLGLMEAGATNQT